MGNDMKKNEYYEAKDLFYLILENGEEVECEVAGVFEVKNKEYIALLSKIENNIFLYEHKVLGDEINFIPIEDEKELELVSETYFKLFKED